jgi:ATP/maltotriose-dependent transcriptional regulator MalT
MSRPEPDDTLQQHRTVEAELDAEGLERAEVIGRGGFGTVFRCYQAALGRTVAVKVLSSDFDADGRARFLREQRAMAQLSGHPNVVEVLHADVTASGRPYIVMPYHPRDSLAVHLKQHGPLPWPEAVRIGVKLAGALESAHQLGMLHRDVKPGNVLVTEYGEPQLTDFGIARVAGGFETKPDVILGSPAYTAPEIVSGTAPSVASDIYGLGATLFCLVTGHAAVERRAGEDVVAHFLRVASTPVSDLGPQFPRDLCEVIQHTMAMNPSDRPATAAQVGERLRDVQRRHGHHVVDMALLGAAGHNEIITRAVTAPPPSVATKFRPPLATRALVPRARLIERIAAAGRKRLIVIHAPAGFGKTTLAAQWRGRLISEDAGVAWLSIDTDDNNITWFLEHVIQAIRQVRPDLAVELRQVLEEHGDRAERYVLTTLVNEIHETSRRFAVVLDDWHRITDPATIAAVNFLLENGCHHFQMIVTSRTRQGLPLSRMRVQNELVEIDSGELRFNTDESHEFLNGLCHLSLAEHDVAHLHELTDGWVAALQLASLSLREHDDPSDFIDHLSGRHRTIAEYLADNVLNTLEPTLLDFMLATSVPDRISAELAATLTGRDHCQAILEEVEQRDLFLRALDDDRQWFRYHHLFADFLRRRLERDHPGRLSNLHSTASKWFFDHAMISDAVDHALAAGDAERAADLVESDRTNLVEHSQMSTLLGLIAKLPPELVRVRPVLHIARGWADVLLHHPPEPIQKSLAACKTTLLAQNRTDDDQVLEASLVYAVADLFADRIHNLREAASKVLARPESLRPFVAASAANVASFEALHRFEFTSARSWLEQGMPYHERTTGPFAVMYGYCFAGMAAREQLDVVAAENLFRTAQQLAYRMGGAHSYSARLAGVVLGELLYERGELDEAEHLIDESYQLGSEGGVVDFMVITYGLGARIKAARGYRDLATRRLDEGERIARSLSLPRLAARIENERVRCGLLQRDSVFTPQPLGNSTSPDGRVDGIAVATRELIEDSHIRALLRGSTADIVEAGAMAQAHMTRIDATARPRAYLQSTLLLGGCLYAAGRVGKALDLVVPAVVKCADLGLPRLLSDGAPQMPSIARAIIDDQQGAWPQLPRSLLKDIAG